MESSFGGTLDRQDGQWDKTQPRGYVHNRCMLLLQQLRYVQGREMNGGIELNLNFVFAVQYLFRPLCKINLPQLPLLVIL
jgi:hypothetical protein